jgi:hypothetical protein
LGFKPDGGFTEQHDIFFGIGDSLGKLLPQMNHFWPEAKDRIHIDAWREISVIDGYAVKVVKKELETISKNKLFFLNLGGYKENDFEEYHYKVLTVAKTLAEATKNAKATVFYKHRSFQEAFSHIDDKYGLDVDNVYNVEEILDESFKAQYSLSFSKPETELPQDILYIGYLKIDRL